MVLDYCSYHSGFTLKHIANNYLIQCGVGRMSQDMDLQYKQRIKSFENELL